MTNETNVTETMGLKVSDRCDLCGAQAFVEVVMESGSLLFCGHHARALRDSYSKTAKEIRDFTDQLYTAAD
ncbi:MAG: hypothetical protein Q4E01_06305 [Actinomycetaceae bacterium]|nr:hypothetical protein [Actinomycetaceae bacterium]